MSRNFPSFQEQIVGAPLAHQHRLHSLLLQRRWTSQFSKSLHMQRNSHWDEFREKSLKVEMLQHSILAEQLAAGISRLKVVVSIKFKT